MASDPQFTEMYLEWPLSKMLVKFWSAHEHGSGEWGLLDYMNINMNIKNLLWNYWWFWNNLIVMFLEWPFSELFLKFWSVNKHGISEWGLLALYWHEENSCKFFSESDQKEMARAISKNKVSDPGPFWPSCFLFPQIFYSIKEKNDHWNINLLSANAFNLVTSKMLPFAKGLQGRCYKPFLLFSQCFPQLYIFSAVLCGNGLTRQCRNTVVTKCDLTPLQSLTEIYILYTDSQTGWFQYTSENISFARGYNNSSKISSLKYDSTARSWLLNAFPVFTSLQYKSFENTTGKGKIAC